MYVSKTNTCRSLLAAFVFLALSLSVSRSEAQTTPSTIGQLNDSQLRQSLERNLKDATNGVSAPELYPGEKDDVGPQSVLAVRPRHTWVDASADVQYYFSDNSLLDPSNHISSGILISTAQFAVTPPSYELFGGHATPRIGVRQQWFNFLELKSYQPNLNSFDFISQTAYVDERWNRDSWFVGAGLDATRLVTPSEYHQFYREYVPRWEVSRLVEVNRKGNLMLSYNGNVRITRSPQYSVFIPRLSANYYDRFENIIQASFVWTPCEYALIQPFYSFRYTHYISQLSRDDKLHSFGLAGYWFINKYVTLRSYTSFEKRDSSVINGDYEQFTAGMGVNLNVKF